METIWLTKAEKILAEVAAGGDYESEYDGRMYIFCKYCEINKEQGDCEDDCLSLQARAELGDKWHEIKRVKAGISIEQEKETQRLVDMENKRKAIQAERVRRVQCNKCHRTVANDGLVSHQLSERCIKRAQALTLNPPVDVM